MQGLSCKFLQNISIQNKYIHRMLWFGSTWPGLIHTQDAVDAKNLCDPKQPKS